MTKRTRVLFVCTANAARSQMAEGLLQAKYGDHFEVFSAGSRLSRVSIHAIQVMQEIGIDISKHSSKTLDELAGLAFDLAVMLCDHTPQVCPVIPFAKKTVHCGFPDPSLLPGSNEELRQGYRNVRDIITVWIDKTFGIYAP